MPLFYSGIASNTSIYLNVLIELDTFIKNGIL
jgi:hypothetical protein